ncbi:MAG TPA: DUF1565 domain-containing protein, partial [Bacteroidia bacterium]|nr:DUF1565 domain-containing protein [Bacteroidia bacterium]
MKKWITVLFLSVPGFLSIEAQQLQSLYVSMDGDNSNPGTLTHPFRTIQHALDQAQAGTAIFVMAGTYAETLTASVTGTAAQPVSLKNYSGQNAIIDGAYATGAPLLSINNASYFTVSGLQFSGY